MMMYTIMMMEMTLEAAYKLMHPPHAFLGIRDEGGLIGMFESTWIDIVVIDRP